MENSQLLGFLLVNATMVLPLFWGIGGIYRFNYRNTFLTGGGCVAGRHSRLRLGWRILTTIIGVAFSPGLLILYIIFKTGNWKYKIKNNGLYSYKTDEYQFTKKFHFFFEDQILYDERGNLCQMF